MGIVLFTLFTIMELVLTVITCTKCREKLSWYKNRTAFTAAELIILILTIIFPINRKWRFACCIAVVAVRLAISGIILLAKKKKATGIKSKAGTIIGALFTTLLMGISLVPAFVFSGYDGLELTGEYGVKTTSAILIDSSRKEEHETDGSDREIPVHFYYPDSDVKDCPFVLFAHGSFGYYESNSSLYAELASNGYVVASIDHPYYAFFTTDTSGNTIIVDMNFMQTAISMENNQTTREDDFKYTREWLDMRAADENFVLDSIKSAKADNSLSSAWNTDSSAEILEAIRMTDTNKIGLTGHSIGGATAVKLGRERDDITAVIDIDGTMSSEDIDLVDGKYVYNDEAYPIPLLALDNERHGTYYEASPYDDGLEYVNKHVMDNAVDGREMSFAGTTHMDFTDLPLLSPALAEMLGGKSSVDSREFTPQLNEIILNYFNYYLKGEGELMVGEWK